MRNPCGYSLRITHHVSYITHHVSRITHYNTMYNLFWAILILFLFGVLLRLDWVYYLVYVLGGVWVVSHWWIRRAVQNIVIERRMVDHAFLGERIRVQLRFLNHSWLPLPWLQVQELVPLDLRDAADYTIVLSVGGRAVTEHEYTLHCKRRGYYTVGPLALRAGDLFGFVDQSWQERQLVSLTVYPEVLTLIKLGLPSRSPFGTAASRQRLFEDPARIAGVRAYTSGDNQRAIHWKASAHEDTLLVKKFQPAIALNVTIVLDLNRKAYPYREEAGLSEWAIVVAASVASHLIGERQAVGLLTNGLDAPTERPMTPIHARTGQGQLMNILTGLARVEMHEHEQPLAAWLPGQITDLEWGTTLIVITPQMDEDLLWVLHNAYRRGSNIIALVCSGQSDFNAMQGRGKRLGVTMYKTVWQKDLEQLAA
jgi:uncharacterized protein (DUF58 family)